MRTDPDLHEIAAAGAQWCSTPGAPDIEVALPYLASSTHADAWIVGAWCHYWTGAGPRAIRQGRGHRIRLVDRHGSERTVRVLLPINHRTGVENVFTADRVIA